MDKEQEQLKILSSVRLSQKEKETMRTRISEYMTLRPVRATSDSRAYASPLSWIGISMVHGYRFVAAVLVVALFTGGVVFASEGALPGDILYPIKISVTEKVRVALATDPAEQAELQSKLMDRRIEEARELSKEDKLDSKKQEILETQIAHHAEAQQKSLAAIGHGHAADPDIVALKVEGTIRAHQEVIDSLVAKDTPLAAADKEDGEGAISTLMAPADAGTSTEEATTSAESLKSEAEANLEIVESEEDEIEKLLDLYRDNLERRPLLDIQDKMRELDNTVDHGKRYVREEVYEGANKYFKEGIVLAEEIKSLILIHVRVDLGVLPQVETDDEDDPSATRLVSNEDDQEGESTETEEDPAPDETVATTSATTSSEENNTIIDLNADMLASPSLFRE